MIRTKRNRPTYYLECDRCNVQSPAALSQESALRLARENGWRIKDWNEPSLTIRHLCPWCQREENGQK